MSVNPHLGAFFFVLFSFVALAGGVGVVLLRSPIRCAISLIASLLGVAGLFLLQQAEFLFAVQIVLYVGGIMLLFVFLVMLVDVESFSGQRKYVKRWGVGLAALVAITIPVAGFVSRAELPGFEPTGGLATRPNVEEIADRLLRDHAAAFELTSLLLLAAMVGAVYLAKRRES
jgi:NADH-quinone oxidoreductase subunit J